MHGLLETHRKLLCSMSIEHPSCDHRRYQAPTLCKAEGGCDCADHRISRGSLNVVLMLVGVCIQLKLTEQRLSSRDWAELCGRKVSVMQFLYHGKAYSLTKNRVSNLHTRSNEQPSLPVA